MRERRRRMKRGVALLLALAMILSGIGPNLIDPVRAAESDDSPVVHESVGTSNDAEQVEAEESNAEASDVIDAENSDVSDETEAAKTEEIRETEFAEDKTAAEDAEADSLEVVLTKHVAESGCTVTINATKESLPYPVDELELSVREIKSDTDEYAKYLNETVELLEWDDTDNIAFARYFDIEILKNGEKIEPLSPATVKIEYDDAPEVPDGGEMTIVHFADDGTEVIDDVDVNEDITEIVYEQESFSVTATVISVPDVPAPTSEGKRFALVAYRDGKAYVVQGDGTLSEVESFEKSGTDIIKVKTNTPMLWMYILEDGKTYLRYAVEGYDFDWTQQATNFAQGYLDPMSSTGVAREKVDHVEDGHTFFDNTKEHCGVTVDNNRQIYHEDDTRRYYICANEEGTNLIGGLDSSNPEDREQINSTKFYLCEAEGGMTELTDNDLPRYNMVNHIDISVSDTVEATLPLAYGTYYDASGNPIYVVNKNTPDEKKKTKVKKEVKIKQEYLRTAKLEAKCNGEDLDNAFIITGYSSNAPSGLSGTQVRIEGRFKVANLAPYSENNPPEAREARLKPENQIIYTISATQPNEEFTYTHPETGETLYDSKGKPITTEGEVTIEASFSYWDENNKCPPLNDYGEDWHNGWRNGNILFTGTSGMDFELTGTSDVKLDPVSIEITKSIVDTDGNIIKPSEDITDLKFDVYQSLGASADSVINLNVDSYTQEADYSGYVNTHADHLTVNKADGYGAIFDYDVDQGMIYISEDKSTIPNQITDKDGKIWVYKESYIKTEYVWRKQGDEGKTHVSKTYTKDDDELKSVPEILGNYGEKDAQENRLFNQFLEFDVYNVYEQPEPHKKEVSPYDGTGELGNVKVGDKITYEISYKNYKDAAADIVINDKLDDNVTFVSASDGGTVSGQAGTENAGGKVTWTLNDVAAGTEGTVTLTVRVLESAQSSKGGPAKVVNGGDTATVKVGNDPEYTLDTVENPVDEYTPEEPHKKETAPYDGNGVLGAVKVGDEITYEISYKNYTTIPQTIVIKDQLDANVAFVSADNGGINDNGTVRWIIKDVPAGAEGKVTLTVKVLEGALKSKGGPDKVVNGGETATVQIGNDDIYTLEIVENPVKEKSAGTTETSDKTSNKTSDKTPNKTSNTTAVKTGDETALLTLFLMMSIAAAGVVAVLYKKRKRR